MKYYTASLFSTLYYLITLLPLEHYYPSSLPIFVSISLKYKCSLISGSALIWLLVRNNESACNISVKDGLIGLNKTVKPFPLHFFHVKDVPFHKLQAKAITKRL